MAVRKKKTLHRFAAACLMISIIPILLLGSGFVVVQHNSEKNSILDSELQKAEMAAASFDRMIDKIESVAAHFSSQYAGKPTDDEQIKRQFHTYDDTFALTGSLFYYARGEQKIYTSDGSLPYGMFEEGNEFANELSMISFYTKLNTSNSKIYTETKGLNNESNYFLCMYPIPELSANPDGMLFYVMSSSAITDIVEDAMADFQGYYAIFGPDKYTMFMLNNYPEGSEKAAKAVLTPMKGTRIIRTAINGEKFTVIRLLSEKHGFAYTSAVPDRLLFAKLIRKTEIYAALVLGIMMAAVVLSLAVARWQTKPVYQLAETINVDADDNLDSDTDIFAAMEQQFRSIQNENERLVLSVHSYAESSRNHLLEGLAKGNFTSQQSLDEAMKSCGISFDHSSFFVMVITFSSPQRETDDIIRLLGEVTFPSGKAYAFPSGMDGGIGLLVNADEKTAETSDALRSSSAEQFRKRLGRMGLSPETIGVSRIRHNALRVNQQLFEAIAALEWQVNGTGLFTQEQEAESRFPFQECEAFRQSLLFGNEQSALKTVHRLTEQISREHWAIDKAQSLLFRLVNTLLEVSSNFPGIRLPVDELTLTASSGVPEYVENNMQVSVKNLCSAVLNQKAAAEKKMNQTVVDYVYQHFAESTLTTESMAEEFRCTESRIKNILRDATGMTLPNFITTLRMSYVKKQLSETSRPIKDIIESAGYVDVSSFTRKFKAMEGVTPGQYRTAAQAEE